MSLFLVSGVEMVDVLLQIYTSLCHFLCVQGGNARPLTPDSTKKKILTKPRLLFFPEKLKDFHGFLVNINICQIVNYHCLFYKWTA